MAEVLDYTRARGLAENLLDKLDEEGYNGAESLPALALALGTLASEQPEPDNALDEALVLAASEFDEIMEDEDQDET